MAKHGVWTYNYNGNTLEEPVQRAFVLSPRKQRIADTICSVFGHKWDHARPHHEWEKEFCTRCGVMRACLDCEQGVLHAVPTYIDMMYLDHGGEA